MSDFFNSDIIQDEIKEINNLQEEIYGTVMKFGYFSKEEKMEHIDKMIKLLDKQKVMYTRVSLSDDPQAIKMKENLKKSIVMMGIPESTDMMTVFSNMKETIESLRKYID